MNDETTLCMSTLEFTTLENIESTLSNSTSYGQLLTTSKQLCPFQHRFLQRSVTMKQRSESDQFKF